jgi:hypothetical protein
MIVALRKRHRCRILHVRERTPELEQELHGHHLRRSRRSRQHDTQDPLPHGLCVVCVEKQ